MFAHWYVLVVIIDETRVEVWDPLPSATTSDLAIEECKHVVSYVLLIARVVTYYWGKLLKQLLFLGNDDLCHIVVQKCTLKPL